MMLLLVLRAGREFIVRLSIVQLPVPQTVNGHGIAETSADLAGTIRKELAEYANTIKTTRRLFMASR